MRNATELAPVYFHETSRDKDFIYLELKMTGGKEYTVHFKVRRFYAGSIGKAVRRLIPVKRLP